MPATAARANSQLFIAYEIAGHDVLFGYLKKMSTLELKVGEAKSIFISDKEAPLLKTKP